MDEQLLGSAVIFLDFDGVLHPANYLRFEEIDDELVLAEDARCCWSETLWGLIGKYDCQVVVHSSWRESHTLQSLQDLLPSELAKRVVAVTIGGNRYKSILDYVEDAKVRDYIILDDSADEFPIGCGDLLLCDGNTGISSPEIQKQLKNFLKRSATQRDHHEP